MTKVPCENHVYPFRLLQTLASLLPPSTLSLASCARAAWRKPHGHITSHWESTNGWNLKMVPPPKKKGKTSNQIINSWVQHVTFRGCKSSCKDVLFTNTNPQKTVQNHDSRIFSRRKTMNTRLKKVGKTGLMIFFDENVSRELFKSWFSDGFDKLVAKKHVFKRKKKRGNKNPEVRSAGRCEDGQLKWWNDCSWLFLRKDIPSRELTYPTFGKGKSSSKLPFQEIC